VNPPSKDPAAEIADLRERLALANAARDDLLAQCQDMLRLVEELQGRLRELEEHCARVASGR
jgi:1,2-phenylacetyl-CoA epoxidase catalytic subunit